MSDFLFQAYFLRLLVFIYVLTAFEASYEMKVHINCSFYEMVDFFELDMSPEPVFFQIKKKQFSQKYKTCSRLLEGPQKVLQTPKVARKLQSTILVHGVVYCGYSVTHLLSSSCCYNLEIICNHCKL